MPAGQTKAAGGVKSRSTSLSHAAEGRTQRGLSLGGAKSKAAFSDAEREFLERLQYMDTALEAMPGLTLRQYFSPVLRLQKNIIMRKHRTKLNMEPVLRELQFVREGTGSGDPSGRKIITDALNRLCKNLSDLGSELMPGATMPLDVEQMVDTLRPCVEPISYAPDEVLVFPNESPESMFVYILLSGSATVTHFQPILQRTTLAGQSRRQFFLSGKDTVLLCGGGQLPDHRALVTGGKEKDGNNPNETGSGDGASALGGGHHHHEGASVNNMTSAVAKNLRNAMRFVGQPTLEPVRSESLKSPGVLGGMEALGMGPYHCATVTASRAISKQDSRLTGEHLDVLRIRMSVVHDALVNAALHAAPASASSSPPPSPSTKENNRGEAEEAGKANSHHHHHHQSHNNDSTSLKSAGATLADFIMSARSRAITSYYPQSETLMRQSWLLQDTPAQTIRHLISHLTPHTYMPGDILACPHGSSPRQLCFLRRGEFYISEPPPEESNQRRSHHKHVVCNCDSRTCGDVYEVIKPGSSYGELSVLFGEPRDYTLIAKTVCDVWCLTYRDFSLTMQRDDALRKSLVQKAAALRIKWLAEQRFSPSLTKHLRESCEMFRPFPDIVLRLIQERIEPVVYSPGELVASTAERCKEMIFIVQGKVASLVKGLASYGPGHVLGGGCLVAHRWPIALSAQTMVEGWRLPRERLLDALERADFLQSHSGERTSMFSHYMRQIFRPSLPELESAVHRNQMPVVAAAPGNLRYPEYGIRVSEVLLRAVCVLFKGFVKWEDINYASMTTGKTGQVNNQLAREEAIRSLREGLQSRRRTDEEHSPRPHKVEVRESIGAAIDREQRLLGESDKKKKKKKNAGESALARRIENPDSEEHSVTGGGLPGARGGMQKHLRKRTTGSCPFLVDEDAAEKPFSSVTGRRPPLEKRVNPDYIQKMQQKPLLDSCFSVQDPSSTSRLRRLFRMPLKLQQFKRLLDERDIVCAAEQHLTALAPKPGGNTAVNNVSTVAEDDGYGVPKFSTRELQQLANTAQMIMEDRCDSGMRGDAVAALPPAHLFLLVDKPKSEISMEEAMAIGYVLRLPNSSSIQACVPIVDPDVCIGLPRHRPRRFAMAMTPNDRHHKNNFLFAAACFEDVEGNEHSGSSPGGRSQPVSGGRSGRSEATSGRSQSVTSAGGESARSSTSGRSAVSNGVSITGAGGVATASTPAEKELQRLKTETLMGMLRASISERQQEYFQRSVQAVKNRATTSLQQYAPRQTSAEPTPRASQPEDFTGGSQSSAYGAPEVSVGADSTGYSGSPDAASQIGCISIAGGKEGLNPTREEREQEETLMVQVLSRDPERALEMLFTRFEATSGPSNSSRALRVSAATGEFAFPAEEGISSETGPSSFRLPRQTMLERLKELYHYSTSSPTSAKMSGMGPLAVAPGEGGDATPSSPAVAFQFVRVNRHGKLQLSSMASGVSSETRPGAAVVTFGTSGTDSQTPLSSLVEGGSTTSPRVGHTASPLDKLFADTRKPLFVDGLGVLRQEPGPATEPSSADMAGPGSRFRAGFTSGGRSSFSVSIGFNPDLSMAGLSVSGADHPLSEDGLGGRGVSRRYSLSGGMRSPAADLLPVLKPSDFVMPSVQEAGEFMDRLQRDVEGLNAVAAEQTREREHLRLEQLRRGKGYEAIQQALAKPTTEESELLERWRAEQEQLLHDPLQLSRIPKPLLRHAGANYLEEEIRDTNRYVAPLSTTNKSVLAWHDQIEEEGGAAGGSGVVVGLVDPLHGLPTETSYTRHNNNASLTNITSYSSVARGGLMKKSAGIEGGSSSVASVSATGGTGLRRATAAKRALAPVGTHQMGFASTPLHHPGMHMDGSTYSNWVQQREEFLENYAKMFEKEAGTDDHE